MNDGKALVFISHVDAEAPIAELLKDFLLRSFRGGIEVFVSSDYTSIETGERPFHRILSSLESAAVVILLLSEVALERRWINFEAGFAYARLNGSTEHNAAKIIPLAIRSQEENVGPPLAELQVRRLADEAVLCNLVKDIAQHLQLAPARADRTVFLRKLAAIEQELQRQDIRVQPVLTPNSRGDMELVFDLVHPLTCCVRVDRIMAGIPEMFLDRVNYQPSEALNIKEYKEECEGWAYLFKQVTPDPHLLFLNRQPSQGPSALPAYLVPEQSRVELQEPRFLLKEISSSWPDEPPVVHRLIVQGHSSTLIRSALSRIGQDMDR